MTNQSTRNKFVLVPSRIQPEKTLIEVINEATLKLCLVVGITRVLADVGKDPDIVPLCNASEALYAAGELAEQVSDLIASMDVPVCSCGREVAK